MGILESLIQADEAGRQRFIGSLARLNQQKQQDIATQKAQTIRNLGIKFMQQGDFTAEGLKSFAEENQVDMETMNELVKVVKQFREFRDKKELEKVRVGEQEVAGTFEPYTGVFAPIAAGSAFAPSSPREQAFQQLTPEEQKLSLLGRPPAPTAKETEINLMRKFAGYPEGSPEQEMYQRFIKGTGGTSELQTLAEFGKSPTGSVERKIFERRIAGAEERPGKVSGSVFDDIAAAYKVSSMDRIDPVTRTKILHASEIAETMIAEGTPRNKAINQAVVSTEKQVKALEDIPRANPGNIFNNIDETRTAIQKALDVNALMIDIREVLSTQGWEPEEIETHFGDLLIEEEESKPAEAAPAEKTEGTVLTDKIISDLSKEFDGDMKKVKQAILDRGYDYSKYKAGE